MSKKKLKKLLRKALKNASATENTAVAEYSDSGRGSVNVNTDDGGGNNWLNALGLPRGFGAGTTEQFVIGTLLGAGAFYVLADEKLRGKILKSVIKLYTGMAGSIEEFKEQIADLKAEIEAGAEASADA
ncbi:hypothetical protein FACS189475_07880 [Betaproteobacteria bacterium]|nr:hypothetical protein FACS189475_07880 [Betaproteobacteria bacterium]